MPRVVHGYRTIRQDEHSLSLCSCLTLPEFQLFTTLQYSKIGKVMRHIHLQPSDKIPRDEEFAFRTRAKALVDKWHIILSANKEAGPGANGTPAGSSPTAPSKADKAEEEAPNGAAAPSAADASGADGTTSVDVTMAET